MVKKAARKTILTHLKSLPRTELLEKSQLACQQLAQCDEFEKAGSVMLFLSLPEEIDTQVALEAAFNRGKTVLVPSIDWESWQIIPMIMPSFDCEMVNDRYDLRHPANGQTIPIDQVELVIVPGLGFDVHGNRLGRGGGFYDRFLCHVGFTGLTCGLAIEDQVFDTVPVAEHDVQLDMMVTDKAIRRFYSRS